MVNSRAKGARGEREWAKLCREHGYGEARRGQQYCGANGDADVVGIPGIHCEVKRVERLNIHEAMGQAVDDAPDGETPVVCHRKDRTDWLVTMRAEDWFALLQKAECLEEFAAWAQSVQPQALEQIRESGLVFDQTPPQNPFRALAFRLYTHLCEINLRARSVLDDVEEDCE